ncbi:MFS transporter [Streptomyces sp. MUSC 125]|uniref:MFS transporter n=1 Tax=unclassified Streptomyces TaxID=2593676 RepID=UPI00057E2A9E|nr:MULTISPECIES: MFS transporter [unclassified Streptomyces]KIE24663.1 MFS transporter [Streptomyces sp. MUSC 125]MCH0560900.1 MFS transporter [Streptomyces sp. MUM 16J]
MRVSQGSRGHPRRWLILGVICLVQLTVLLDNTVLNVAIPSLKRELHAATSDVQWLINAYSLVQSGLLLTAGSAADRYGRKKMLIAGLVLFGAGSLVAGFAGATGQLIAARAGMGIGGALLMTTTLAVAVQIFAPEEQPKAIGIWSAVNALGFAGGPLIGGLVLDHFWWGAIFLVNLPVVVLGLCAVAALVPESKAPRAERPDLLGALLSTIGMTSLVYAIIAGPGHGWTSVRVLVTTVVAAGALSAFAWWEGTVTEPMLDPRFFRDRHFTGAVAGAVLITFGMGGALFLLTQHLQSVLGYGPLEAGLRTAPLALTVVALNFTGLSAKWSARWGTPVSIALGMLLMSAGLVAIAAVAPSGYAGTLLGLLLIGAGCAIANPALAHAIMSAIPPQRAGAGAGINGTVAEFGNGLGVAVLGAVLSSRIDSGQPLSAALGAGQLVGAVAVLAGGFLAAGLLRRAERATVG